METYRCGFAEKLGCVFIAVLMLHASPSLGADADKPQPKAASPTIEVTTPAEQLPHAPDGGPKLVPIAGRVGGIDPKRVNEYMALVYCKTNMWYVQPTTAEPLTEISKELTFETDTHPGVWYVALLVASSYKPEDTLDELPKPDGKMILAVSARVRGQKK